MRISDWSSDVCSSDLSRETREAIRVANSPISVAFDDPVLRADGMTDDSYGEAKRFFGISDQQLHAIVCYCHFCSTMSAESAALRVRSIVGRGSRDRKGPRLNSSH